MSDLLHMADIRAIFSDIDGTVVHYEKTMKAQGYVMLDTSGEVNTSSSVDSCIVQGVRSGVAVERVQWLHVPSGTRLWCLKVPSLTLGGGYISEATLGMADELRIAYGVPFILMTGARTSTMLMRRKSATLPTTEYDICEGGGKLWRRNGAPPLADAELDEGWTQQFAAVTGPMEQLDSEPSTRIGPLWDVFRILDADGFHLDAKSFSTSFLVDVSKSSLVASGQCSTAEAEIYLKRKFESDDFARRFHVTYITNLGKGQVCPVGCNKQAAMLHVAHALCIDTSSCVALFDDENDLEFAKLCGAGFIPSVAHASVIAALSALEDSSAVCRWTRPPIEGPLGTDYALAQCIAFKKEKMSRGV